MEPQNLLEMVEQGESLTVEFKGESKGSLNDKKLLEFVACLANGSGGTLLIGVEDDGTVTGCRPRHSSGTDVDRVQALIVNRTTPGLAVDVRLEELKGHDVLVIEVPRSDIPVGTTEGKYLRRALSTKGRPQCLPYRSDELMRHQLSLGSVDYAGLPARGATWQDLDPLEFERFRALVRRSGPSADSALGGLDDPEIARALGVLLDRDGGQELTLGAILLFGTETSLRRWVPNHELAFQVLSSDEVVVNKYRVLPLLAAAEWLTEQIEARNPEEELQAGLVRVAVPVVPYEAVREAVANALVHRDYSINGPVQVQFDEDRLRCSSPGGFPEGVRLNNILEMHRPRSRILADAFKRTGLVERTGRGVKRMFSSRLRVGRPPPDFSMTDDHSVVLDFAAGRADLKMIEFVLDRESKRGRAFTLTELQVLHALRQEPRIGVQEVAELLQVSPTVARSALGRMVEEGLIEERGAVRSRTYHLGAEAHRALGTPSGYVRSRGFDAIQQRQLVLNYVEAHGEIARRQAAELCGIPPTQASRLLRELVDSGDLVMVGSRRGSRYRARRPAADDSA